MYIPVNPLLTVFYLFSCRMFSYGEFKQEDQEKMLEQLNKKVEEVYRSCIGDNEANIRLVALSISTIPLQTWSRKEIGNIGRYCCKSIASASM